MATVSSVGPTPSRLRCFVADDHPAIVDAVCRFIESSDDFELAGRATEGEQALRLIRSTVPEVAILDVRMPQMGGIDITRQRAAGKSATASILYTGYPDRALLLEALDAGARGFMLKEAPLDDVTRAIKIVGAGGTYVDASLAMVIAGPEAT